MKIQYRHFRVLEATLLGDVFPSRIMLPYSRSNPKFTPAPTGGETVCELSEVSADGKVYRGISACSDSDRFSYKAERELALFRAKEELLQPSEE